MGSGDDEVGSGEGFHVTGVALADDVADEIRTEDGDGIMKDGSGAELVVAGPLQAGILNQQKPQRG